jgi:subtilase family serine protease
LSSAGHDAYLVETLGALYEVYGTSAASPSMAGLMALVVEKTGQSQGNANTRFYQLGNAQYGAGGVVVFHDITSGSNSVPGVTGYSAGTGYSCTTGLGSMDAYALVMNWTPDFAIAASPNAFSIDQGSAGTSTIQTNVLGNFDSAVALSASGLPTAVTAGFSPTTIAAPGSGSSTMTITVGASSPAGSYPIW